MMVLTGLLGISPLLCIISSYAHIFLAVAQDPAAQGKKQSPGYMHKKSLKGKLQPWLVQRGECRKSDRVKVRAELL